MSKKSILIEPTSSTSISLSQDHQFVLSNRFSKRFLRDNYTITMNDDSIELTFVDSEVDTELVRLKKALEKYQFSTEYGERAQSVLHRHLVEEENFQTFAQEAYDIRNNDFTSDGLKAFSEVLGEELTTRTLYELQLLSAYHLAFSQNACNFSVPGAGKTSIVYGAYAYLRQLPEDDLKRVDNLLIVGPLNSFGPWELEYKECFGSSPDSMRLLSSINKLDKLDYLHQDDPCEMTLISYNSVPILLKELRYFLRHNRTMVVLDEAHKIKNTQGGIIAKSVLELAKSSRSRVVLTGTPAPNGYEDLFNIFEFIWPNKKLLGFKLNQLVDMKHRPEDPRIERLIENISPFFIRIKKSDLGIPQPIIHPPILVEMGEVQRRIYDFIEKKYIDEMIDTDNELLFDIKNNLANAKLIRLMQVSTNPSLILNPINELIEDSTYESRDAYLDNDLMNEILNYKGKEVPAKFIEILDLVRSIISTGQRVIIWATFIQTINDLKEFLSSKGIQAQELYGATPIDSDTTDHDEQVLTRERIVSMFHEDDCPFDVIIANPFAIGESISLHKACHNAIYIERTFNAAHFMQSKDRIHRYGLKEDDVINYYYIVAKDSIDEVINDRLNLKERRMLDIIESESIPLFDNLDDELGKEDIKAVINDYIKRSRARD